MRELQIERFPPNEARILEPGDIYLLSEHKALAVARTVPYFWTRQRDGNNWLGVVIARKRQKIAESRAQANRTWKG